MLAARTKKIMSHRQADPLMEDGQILARLVCYTSKLVNKKNFAGSLSSTLIVFSLGAFMPGESRSDCDGSRTSIIGG